MAQELGISKAALAASLFKADPTSLPRTTVDDLFTLLGSAVTKCSRPNVQNCKAWIVTNIVPSKNRSVALGRYLVALSRSLDSNQKPSVRRRRLHLLYVINDVLHHVKTNLGDASFGDALEAHLPVLVATVAEFKDCPKHMKKFALLLDIWENKAYVSPAHLATLRKAAAGDPSTTVPAEAQSVTSSLRISKEAPYTLPSYHGDPSTPWYDLPAATWLPHITPNSTRPMLPDLIKPIQLAPGPADPKLVAAVQDLLRDVELLFSKERKADEEPYDQINELGEQVYLDEITAASTSAPSAPAVESNGAPIGQPSSTTSSPRLEWTVAAASPFAERDASRLDAWNDDSSEYDGTKRMERWAASSAATASAK
ncbi:uncharacterized protein J7T54_008008 [Emericellopsis cladophorae]|uniref:CID domain-containing protein n=1 Tax=Emericellopsis cladophorae TaxID=2686198 RepID=A0A9P9Y7F8_9HYPO|nr:uncharacterized protein J7T54_008008 [Emericellopsis cladophorae]KAI6784914.1 hypothetical protein J7T54_008008 [Emericellopsis cladophorae]